MSKALEFLKKHNMNYDSIVIQEQIPRYIDEMQKGLDGKESSLLMLLSYISLEDKVRLNTPVICVDAGGTNLRITSSMFDEKGQFTTGKIARYTMPGVKNTVTAEEFFEQLAIYIKPFCEVSKEIVISFAYRAKALEDLDCEIYEITKEVSVVGAEGKHLGKEINTCLEKMGILGCKIIVINDSVATALSGKAQRLNDGFGTFTGTILGTGSNSCYIENFANIGKFKGRKEGVMVINTEAGSYDKIPRSDIDVAFDNTLLNPRIGISEKMSSGGYLGDLCQYTLKCAYEEDVFVVADFSFEKITTMSVNEFLTDGSGVVAQIFERDEDLEAARKILENIVLRSANLVALQMAAMAKKAYKSNNKVCLTIEGTTYEKMYGLKEHAEKVLYEYLKKEGINAEVITVDMAVLKGCAIAALSRFTV